MVKAGGGVLGRFRAVWASSVRSGSVPGRSGLLWAGLGRFGRSGPAPGRLGATQAVWIGLDRSGSGPVWTGLDRNRPGVDLDWPGWGRSGRPDLVRVVRTGSGLLGLVWAVRGESGGPGRSG